MNSVNIGGNINIPNIAAWGLVALGKLWAPKILAAVESVSPSSDLAASKAALGEAVQHCDPDGGVMRVSGTLRGAIQKAFNAAPDLETLGLEVTALVAFLERYVPATEAGTGSAAVSG